MAQLYDKAVERVWNKNKSKIFMSIIMKLARSFNLKDMNFEELTSEMMFLFFTKFDEFYENDNQYLRFMFILFKNKMCDLYKKEKRYHTCILSEDRINSINVGSEYGDEDTNVFTNFIDFFSHTNRRTIDNTLNTVIENEIIKLMNKDLEKKGEESVSIFKLMIKGYRQMEICKELDIHASKVNTIKRKHIWPLAKKVLNISDKDYDYLICSGRIFVTA